MTADAGSENASENPYGWSFAFAYLANVLLMVAVSLLFRYSDFVKFFGGGELELGWIVGVGAIGSLAMRLGQGWAIDRYGARRIWILSSALLMAALLWHLTLTQIDSWQVFVARMLYATSLAGAFGSSITYVSLLAPRERMAEMVGTLGSSGFIGLALGPMLGDWLFGGPPVTADEIDIMFWGAIAAAGLSLLSASLATRDEATQTNAQVGPPLWEIVGVYHPGLLLPVAVAMGIGIGLPMVFLRPFTESNQIEGIQSFFLVYAVTAFAVRMLTRRWTAWLGATNMILVGLAILATSVLLYLPATNLWLLMPSAFAGGVAHALLFPAVVSAGAQAFPDKYRGLGTTLVLSMFDLGSLIGPPTVGSLIRWSEVLGWPPYSVAFSAVAAMLVLIGSVYAADRLRARQADHDREVVGDSSGPVEFASEEMT